MEEKTAKPGFMDSKQLSECLEAFMIECEVMFEKLNEYQMQTKDFEIKLRNQSKTMKSIYDNIKNLENNRSTVDDGNENMRKDTTNVSNGKTSLEATHALEKNMKNDGGGDTTHSSDASIYKTSTCSTNRISGKREYGCNTSNDEIIIPNQGKRSKLMLEDQLMESPSTNITSSSEAHKPRNTIVSMKESEGWMIYYNPNLSYKPFNIQLLCSFKHNSAVCSTVFSPDGKLIATGSSNLIQIFDISGDLLHTFKDENGGPDTYVRSLAFSLDGKYIAAGTESNQIKIWSIKEKLVFKVLNGYDIHSLKYSVDGKTLVSGGEDGVVRLWNQENGKNIESFLDDGQIKQEKNGVGITSISFSNDGAYIVSGSSDKIIRVWDISKKMIVERLEGHRSSVYSVCFSPDDKRIFSGSLDNDIMIWEVGMGKKPRNDPIPKPTILSGHKDFVLSVDSSPDGSFLLSGSKDCTIQCWGIENINRRLNKESYIRYFVLHGHTNSVLSLSINKHFPYFVSGSGDQYARLWKYENLVFRKKRV